MTHRVPPRPPRPASRPASRQAGFTLLEILVAFVVLAVVGGALLQLFQGGITAIRLADAHSRAALLARAQVDALLAHPQPGGSPLAGETADGYRWQWTLTPALNSAGEPLSAAGLQAMHAEITVQWQDPGRRQPHRVTLGTWILVPLDGGTA